MHTGNKDRFSVARGHLEAAHEGFRVAQGASDRATLSVCEALARCLEAMGDVEGARQLLEDAVATSNASHGPSHLRHISLKDELARTLERLHR